MFTRPRNEPDFITPINDLLSELNDADSGSEEYQKLLNKIDQLTGIRNASRPKQVSQDTLVMAGTNLLGILVIVGHERAHVVTSKAMNFIKTMAR